LLHELRAAEFVTRLIDEGKLSTQDYKRVRLHRIHGGPALDEFTAASRLNARWEFFKKLKDLGRSATRQWLADNYQSIGRESTLDLRQAFR
jgi:NTE family protein